MKNCLNCINAQASEGKLFCHAEPPRVIPIIGEVAIQRGGKVAQTPDGIPLTAVSTIGHATVWPEVQKDWLCGKHSGVLRL